MIAVTTALLMLVLIGVAAFAVDLGYIALTKTQLQAACDAAALAAGMELGAAFKETATPEQVAAAAKARAVEYAAMNPNGDRTSSYVDAGDPALPTSRDVNLRTAWYDGVKKEWVMSAPGVIQYYKSYNAVTVQLLRNQPEAGAKKGDESLPLLMAPFFGAAVSQIKVEATVIILPSDGGANVRYPMLLIQ